MAPIPRGPVFRRANQRRRSQHRLGDRRRNRRPASPPRHHLPLRRRREKLCATFLSRPRYPGFNVEKDYFVAEDGQFYSESPRINLDPHDANHVLQINGGECYFTTDGGKFWKTGHTCAVGTAPKGCAWQCTGLVVTTTWHYYIDPHEANRRYICYTDIGFARSLDADKTWLWWSLGARPPWVSTCYELAFDPDVPGASGEHFPMCTTSPMATLFTGTINRPAAAESACPTILRPTGMPWRAACRWGRRRPSFSIPKAPRIRAPSTPASSTMAFTNRPTAAKPGPPKTPASAVPPICASAACNCIPMERSSP